MKTKLKSHSLKNELKKYGPFFTLLIEMLFFSIMTESFLSGSNLLSVGRQIASTGIASIGVALCIILGGIDISVGMVLAFASVIVSKLMVEASLPIPAAILITLLIGACFGGNV